MNILVRSFRTIIIEYIRVAFFIEKFNYMAVFIDPEYWIGDCMNNIFYIGYIFLL